MKRTSQVLKYVVTTEDTKQASKNGGGTIISGPHYQNFTKFVLFFFFCLFVFQTGKCSPDVDVAFLVDSSGSISFRNYRKVRTFVSDLAAKFNISPGGSRAAVVVYSTTASTEIRFRDHTSPESFARAVQGLRHQRGFTRIDLALQRAFFDLFGRRGTARFLVPKLAFVLTDGEQTPASNAIPLERASGWLKNAGVRLIAIGIGKNVKEEELKTIASSDKDVIITDSFDGLLKEVDPLTKAACEGIEGKFAVK